MTTTTLRSVHGLYLCAEADLSVSATRSTPSVWEHWTVEYHANNMIALKSVHGRYLSADPVGVTGNRLAVGPWELFEPRLLGDGVGALVTWRGTFLTAEADPAGKVSMDRSALGPWEEWTSDLFAEPVTPPAPQLGRLSVRDARLFDGQRYIGWRGVSEFDAIHLVRTGQQAELVRRLDRAAANGCNGIRVLMMARNLFRLSPSDGGYWPAVDAAVRFANERGLYVECCLFADAQDVMPNHEFRVSFAHDVAAWCDSQSGVIVQLANEPYKNGWTSATDPLLLDIAARTTFTVPFSIGDPSDCVEDAATGNPLRAELETLGKRSSILVLHAERKSPDSRYAGWVDHLKGFDEVYSNPMRRYRIHDEPMGAASDWQPGRRDNRADAHRAACLVSAVLGIGYTFHYISAQSDATPGMDGQRFASIIPQSPNWQFRNAGTAGACVGKFAGWDKVRTTDNGHEAYAVAYGHAGVTRSIEWVGGWTMRDRVVVGPSVELFRATKA